MTPSERQKYGSFSYTGRINHSNNLYDYEDTHEDTCMCEKCAEAIVDQQKDLGYAPMLLDQMLEQYERDEKDVKLCGWCGERLEDCPNRVLHEFKLNNLQNNLVLITNEVVL